MRVLTAYQRPVLRAAALHCTSARMQDSFFNSKVDYLILPLIAQQLRTAVRDLTTVGEQKGLVRKHPER